MSENVQSYGLNENLKNALDEIARDQNMTDYEASVRKVPFTGDNYGGDISFMQLKSSQNGQEKIVDLFMKKAPSDPVARAKVPVENMYKTEIFTYNSILPAFARLEEEYNIPKEDRILSAKYYKGITKELEELLILSDLSSKGFVMHSKTKPFNIDHATLVITNLAKVHSFSFVLREKYPEVLSNIKSNISTTFVYEKNVMPLLEMFGKNSGKCIQSPVKRAKMETLFENAALTLRTGLDSTLSEPYNVICHGDCWNNNMLFKFKDGKVQDTVLIDWQIVRYACPVTDLMTVICFCMDVELLERHLYSLLDIYHNTLRQQLARMGCDVDKSYPKEAFMDDFKRLLPYGLTMALFVLPFLLCDPNDLKPLSELQDSSQDAISLSSLASKRINEILDYLVKNGFI